MTDIIVELTEEDQETLARYAEVESRTQEEMAAHMLSGLLSNLAKRDASIAASREIINRAFQSLGEGSPKIPDPPTGFVHIHPCEFLDKEPPILYAGQCEGTCMHKAQRGRPCFFGGGSAKQCGFFMSRTVRP